METARRPQGLGWRRAGRIIDPVSQDLLFAWQHVASWTQVLSSLVVADLPKGAGVGPQWHISIVARPGGGDPDRPSAPQVALARCAFGMLGSEEDNHHPGAAVHLWLPVDPNERVDCECKETEVQVVEPDGYRWSNNPVACRGCDLERSMRGVGVTLLCPLHARATSDAAGPALSNGESP